MAQFTRPTPRPGGVGETRAYSLSNGRVLVDYDTELRATPLVRDKNAELVDALLKFDAAVVDVKARSDPDVTDRQRADSLQSAKDAAMKTFEAVPAFLDRQEKLSLAMEESLFSSDPPKALTDVRAQEIRNRFPALDADVRAAVFVKWQSLTSDELKQDEVSFALRADWFETRDRAEARRVLREKLEEENPVLFADFAQDRKNIEFMRTQVVPSLRQQAEELVNLGVSPGVIAMDRARAAARAA